MTAGGWGQASAAEGKQIQMMPVTTRRGGVPGEGQEPIVDTLGRRKATHRQDFRRAV